MASLLSCQDRAVISDISWQGPRISCAECYFGKFKRPDTCTHVIIVIGTDGTDPVVAPSESIGEGSAQPQSGLHPIVASA